MKVELKKRAGIAWSVLKHGARQYGRDHVPRMAAAVSYRTVFAVVPMLVVSMSVAGLVLGADAQVQQETVRNVAELMGQAIANNLDALLDQAKDAAGEAALLGIVVLLWSASTLFLELQRDLNEIFDVEVPQERRLLVLLAQRGIGFLWTLGIGLSILVLFAFNALWQILADLIFDNVDGDLRGPIGVGGSVIAFGFMVIVFGLVFQTLTFEKQPWKPVWVGAFFTASTFTLAGYLTGFYFRILGEPTAFGFASSIVVLLFLAYLLSSVFLFGAQVTQSYKQLVFEADREMFVYSEPVSNEGQSDSKSSLSLAAIAAFFVGLVVGWRKRNR